MARGKKKESALTPEEKLAQALLPDWERPYKVPDNWCWAHWGNCGEFTAGNGFKNEYQGFQNLPIPFYKVGSLKYSDSSGYLYDASNTIDEEIRGKLKATIIPVNSVIFAKIGEAIRLNRRSLNAVPCCIDNNLMAFIANGSCLYSYAFYWSKGTELYDFTNATTVPAIRKSDLEMIPFPLPPLAEQQRIVDRIEYLFTKLDEAKEKAQSVLDSFETRKAAILRNAFHGEYTSGSSVENINSILSCMLSTKENMIRSKQIQRAKVKAWSEEDTIRVFPSEWKQVRVGEIAFVTKLAGFEYTKYIHLEETGEVPVVRAQNVRMGYLSTENLLYIDNETSETLPRSALTKECILVTFIGAGIGDICIFDQKCRFHLAPNVAKVEFFCGGNEELNTKYALYYLLSPYGQHEIFKNMKATAQPSLSMETIRDIIIPIPDKEEQTEIVRILDSLFAKEQQAKEAAEVVLEKIDLLKKSILARAFRGELGTNDPTEESALELLLKSS